MSTGIKIPADATKFACGCACDADGDFFFRTCDYHKQAEREGGGETEQADQTQEATSNG